MHTRLLAIAVAVSLAASAVAQSAAESPALVVRQALAATEGDSVAPLRARWTARLARDGQDRLARLGLASLDRLGYDYAEAERHYAALDRVPDAVAAYARLGRGEAAYTRGDLARADSQLTAARRIPGGLDAAGEAQALALLALSRAPTQGLHIGHALLDTAWRVAPASAAAARAEILRMRLLIYAVEARHDSAAPLLAPCLAAARAAGLARAEAQCHRSQALSFRLQGLDDSAVAVLDVVERLQRQGRDHTALAETLLRRTDALRASGAFGDIPRVLAEAERLARQSQNDFALGSAYNGIASVALRLRDHPTAARALADAERVFERIDDVGSLAGVRSFQSILAAATGDVDAARAHARASADHYRGMGDVSEEFAALRQLASVEMRAGDWTAAARVLAEADALTRRADQPDWRDMLAFDRGRLALRRGRLDEAERELRRYLEARESDEHVVRHTTRGYLAEIHARRGALDLAARELGAANDELDAWRASLPEHGQRELAFQATGHDMDGRDPSAAVVIAALAAGGRVDAALALAEQRRARTLMDRLAQGRALRTGAATSAGTPAAASAPALRLAAGGSVTAGAVAGVTLPDDRTALLEYVAGTDGAPSTLFVVTRQGVRARALPSLDTLTRQIERYATLLESGVAPRALARALGAALLDPATALLDARIERLVVVPDGALHRVPFDALILADGRYAVERFAIGLAPSAAVVGSLWRRARPAADVAAAPLRLLALGDPAFGAEPATDVGDSTTRRWRSTFDSIGGLERLAGSGREARLVARYAPAADVRLRERATASYLKQAALASYRVIHLATHALVDDRIIGRSALALAPGDGESGFLGAGDLGALRLAADLVVLSACRTAGGVVVDGEGVQGLTAPLLEAGARSVVATGWRIGDESVVALVRDFYDALADGAAVGDALRAAKLAAVARGAPASEWAAFTVVGDPTVTVPLRRPRPTWPWLAAGAAGALALVVVVARRRSHTG